MSVLLGIDLGTSSIKAMLMDSETGILDIQSSSYAVETPLPGYAEQNPETWWSGLKECLARLKDSQTEAFQAISAVGLSGQMHGLVLSDVSGTPIRPAIVWLDQRSAKQLEEIQRILPESVMGERFRNRVSCGFAFPSLLWLRDQEPESLNHADAVLCPKDWLRLKLTGRVGTERSDASSTCMLETARGDWAWDVLEQFHLPARLFPEVSQSCAVAGTITGTCSEETGLPNGIPVVYGSGDQPAQSIGCGVYREGEVICNIGTGGQISAFSDEPVYDPLLRTNTFCHAIPGGYTVFGATLSAGLSLNWSGKGLFRMENYRMIDDEAANVPAGSDGLIYLPYLCGERAPHMDPEAKGMFFGMQLSHGRGHFLRSVMEGVTYSLRDCLDLMGSIGIRPHSILSSGGGAASPLWLQIQADVFGLPVRAGSAREQACLGACIVAGAGTGVFSIPEACSRFCAPDSQIYEPGLARHAVYEERLAVYRELYKRTDDLMRR